MFLNPVCHWSSGEPPFDGLFELDFRNGPSVQPLPTDTAELASLLGIPAAIASHIYTFDETAGNTVYDHVGGKNMTRVNDALVGQRVNGLGDGAGHLVNTRKAAEIHNASTNGKIAADDPTAFNVPANTDFAYIYVHRAPFYGDASWEDTLFGKSQPGASPKGFHCGVSSNGRLFCTCRFDNAVAGNIYLEYVNCDGSVRCHIVHYDHVAARVYGATPVWTDDGAAAGDSITLDTIPLAFGGQAGGGSTGSASAQPLYFAFFYGAAAAALGNCAAAVASFAKMIEDPNGKMGVVTSLGGGARYQHACIVGDDPVYGIQLADFAYFHYPFAYRAGFTHASKIGMRFSRNYTENRINYTDAYEEAAWVKSNVTVSAAYADLDDSPRGYNESRKVTADADNGYMEIDPATTAAPWDFGVFVKRHKSMGSNVNGRFQVWNAGTASEIAGVDFVGDTKWQHVRLPNQTSVGANDRVRVRIDNSGESLAVSRCYVSGIHNSNFNYTFNNQVKDERPKYIRGTSPAPEDWIHADKGEIEVRFILDGKLDEPYGAATRSIVQFWDGSGATDRHCLQFTLTQKIRYTIWNSAGVSQFCESGVIADPETTEVIVRARWNHSVAEFLGGTYSELIVNGVKTGGVPNPWTINGGVLDTCDLGNNYNGDYMNGVLARVRVWDAPQP